MENLAVIIAGLGMIFAALLLAMVIIMIAAIVLLLCDLIFVTNFGRRTVRKFLDWFIEY